MRAVIYIGAPEGVALFYYPAVAQGMFVGYIVSKGGLGWPGVVIQYHPEHVPTVLRLIHLMESQGRSPQVYLEPNGDRLEVAVVFRAEVTTETLLNLVTDGKHTIDLARMRSEKKADLIVTAETDLSLEGMEESLRWFKAQPFRVVVGRSGQWGVEEIFWKTELNSFEEKLPTFLTQSR